MPTRILLVDDQALFRQGLRLILDRERDLEVVGHAEDGPAAIEMARELAPDLVVVDVAMPGLGGIGATCEALRHVPGLSVVALTASVDRRTVGDTLRSGARGYLLKESAPEELVAALRIVAGGEVSLSPAIAGAVVDEISAGPGEDPDHSRLVLRTRLHPPRLTPDLIPRTRLVGRWDDLRTRPLTVVSAPAGYGKSTLASQWIEAWAGAYGWVSLSDEDNDPRVLLAALVTAIRIPFPGACDETWAVLAAARLPPATALARRLLNDLEDIAEPLVIVLDDYHRIRSPVVHDLLAEMVTHPARGVHLVLLTRRAPPLPVSTLRGRGQVNEIGVADTRFTIEETGYFLEDRLGSHLDAEIVGQFQKRLEGWPAGLRLVAQSIRRGEDVGQVLAGLEGGFASILDYLLDEVLSHLSPAMANLAVETSILDQFCAPLCDALLSAGPGGGEEAFDGREFLARIQRENLFLISLDSRDRWFRFHHLFQELLSVQLSRRRSAEEIAATHLRASGWLAENDHPEEAIRHALAGGDVDGATRLVAAHRQSLLEEDRWFVLERWLAAFPEDVVRRRPVLLLSLIWVLDYRFDHEEFAVALEEADALVAKDDPLRAEVDFFHGYLAYFRCEAKHSIEHLRAALDRVPEGGDEFRAQAEMLLGMARQMAGEEGPALERLSGLLYRGQPLRGGSKTRLQAAICVVHLLQARLPEAESAALGLHRTGTQGGFRHAEAWGAYLRGLCHFWRNESGKSVDLFEQVAARKYIVEWRLALDGMAGLALAGLDSGRDDLADRTLEELFEFADSLEDPSCTHVAESIRTRVSLRRGSAIPLLAVPPPEEENMGWWIEVPAVSWCRDRLAEGSPESLRTARARLVELLAHNEKNKNVLQSIDILCLLALAQDPEGVEEAVALARRAADLAGPGGVWRPFAQAGPPMAELLTRALGADPGAEFVRQARSAIDTEDIGKAPWETGPLTQREFEVLSLVADGLSNKEIAARIHRSTETVKKHLSHVYRKLEVDGRIAAIARAGEFGISVHKSRS